MRGVVFLKVQFLGWVVSCEPEIEEGGMKSYCTGSGVHDEDVRLHRCLTCECQYKGLSWETQSFEPKQATYRYSYLVTHSSSIKAKPMHASIPPPAITIQPLIFLPQRLHSRRSSNIARRSRRRLLPTNSALPTPTTCALPLLAWTIARSACAPTGSHVTARQRLLRLLVLRFAASTAMTALGTIASILHVLLVFLFAMPLSGLEICQTTGFGMNVSDLLIALRIETRQLLPRRSSQRFLEIACHPPPPLRRFVSDTITSIQPLCFVSSLVLLIEGC